MLPDGDLAVAFVEFESQMFGSDACLGKQCGQPLADVGGEELGRGIGNGEQAAIAGRECPVTVAERGGDVSVFFKHLQLGMFGRQEHVVIELGDDRAELIADEQEVDDEVVRIERPMHFGGDPIVVAVQPLTVLTNRDEMGGAEEVFTLGDADVI